MEGGQSKTAFVWRGLWGQGALQSAEDPMSSGVSILRNYMSLQPTVARIVLY